MSRLIVKNLPQSISKEKLKEIFQAHGTLTDIKLSFTKNGKFRRFAFIGYKTSEEAISAKKFLDNSMVMNQKVKVEDCNDLQHSISENNAKIHDKKRLENGNENKHDTKMQKNKKFGKKSSAPAEKSDLEFLNMKKAEGMDIDDVLTDDTEMLTKPAEDQKYSIKIQTPLTKLSEKQVNEFLYPVKPKSVKISKMKGKSIATVCLSTQSDHDKALKFDKDCINGKAVKVTTLKSRSEFDFNGSTLSWKDKITSEKEKLDLEEITESGRLFVRNLAFVCTEEDLEKLFEQFGPLSEVHIPIDTVTRKNMGIGFVTFMMPEHAMVAFNKIDGSVFQGRMIHLLPAKSQPEKEHDTQHGSKLSSYKKEKNAKDKSKSQQAYNWNTLFIGTDAVAGAIAEKYNITKNEFLNADEKGSAAVRVALGETQIVQETRNFLIDNGISLDSFSQPNSERSKSVIIAKNLPIGATASELRSKFEVHGDLGRVLLAPSGVTAVIEFLESTHAKKAFVSLAYRKFHFKPLYLEWAPMNIFSKSYEECKAQKMETNQPEKAEKSELSEKPVSVSDEGTTIFVKNLNFETTEESLKEHFCKCGEIASCTISKKVSSKKEILSMGYGFVQYRRSEDAEKAIKSLQMSLLDGHSLELKMSKRASKNAGVVLRKKQEEKESASSKILIRNIPFQADQKEIRSLFTTFGELKSVRLPKKLKADGMAGSHRGFAFVDYLSKQDAERAFQALCHSTHLYGRRLVLEWAATDEENIEALRRKASESLQGIKKKLKTRGDFEKSLEAKKADS